MSTSSPPDAAEPDGPSARAETGAPASRGELEIRWRQARNVPPPIVRAISADVIVAVAAGLALLAWDLIAGASLGAFVLYLLIVVVAGSLLTYRWAPLPTGASGLRRRSPWAAMLGMFAAFPVAYIVLVVIFQLVRPLL